MPSPKKASPAQVANAVRVLYAGGFLTLNRARNILNKARPTNQGGNANRNRASVVMVGPFNFHRKKVNNGGVPRMGGGFGFRNK